MHMCAQVHGFDCNQLHDLVVCEYECVSLIHPISCRVSCFPLFTLFFFNRRQNDCSLQTKPVVILFFSIW